MMIKSSIGFLTHELLSSGIRDISEPGTNAFYTNSNVLFLIERWTFLESGIPLLFFQFLFQLILPVLGFEPVTSRLHSKPFNQGT